MHAEEKLFSVQAYEYDAIHQAKKKLYIYIYNTIWIAIVYIRFESRNTESARTQLTHFER